MKLTTQAENFTATDKSKIYILLDGFKFNNNCGMEVSLG